MFCYFNTKILLHKLIAMTYSLKLGRHTHTNLYCTKVSHCFGSITSVMHKFILIWQHLLQAKTSMKQNKPSYHQRYSRRSNHDTYRRNQQHQIESIKVIKFQLLFQFTKLGITNNILRYIRNTPSSKQFVGSYIRSWFSSLSNKGCT